MQMQEFYVLDYNAKPFEALHNAERDNKRYFVDVYSPDDAVIERCPWYMFVKTAFICEERDDLEVYGSELKMTRRGIEAVLNSQKTSFVAKEFDMDCEAMIVINNVYLWTSSVADSVRTQIETGVTVCTFSSKGTTLFCNMLKDRVFFHREGGIQPYTEQEMRLRINKYGIAQARGYFRGIPATIRGRRGECILKVAYNKSVNIYVDGSYKGTLTQPYFLPGVPSVGASDRKTSDFGLGTVVGDFRISSIWASAIIEGWSGFMSGRG